MKFNLFIIFYCVSIGIAWDFHKQGIAIGIFALLIFNYLQAIMERLLAIGEGIVAAIKAKEPR